MPITQEQLRPKTQHTVKIPAHRVEKKKEPSNPHLASALLPGFVAEKSNQIWSEVASMKSATPQEPPNRTQVLE
jgi:hypothetical protein